LPERSESYEQAIPLDSIDPPETQHRKTLDPVELGRLVDSIQELGLLQPLGVVQQPTGHRYTLVWGWRRYNALVLANHATARARVFPPDYPADRARAAENEFRQDLNAIERAEVCQRWLDAGVPVAEIARRFRKTPQTISEWLDLVKLPDDLKRAVAAGEIAAAVARELARVDFGDYRAGLIEEAKRTGANTRQVAAWTAAYAADRERIITNTITVQEIVQQAHLFISKVVCEAGGEEVPLDQSRMIRVCAPCYAELMAAFAAALDSATHG
jgi:ParB/RepB/Spo0J family partition protein